MLARKNVRLTRHDIVRGIPRNAHKCAVARALDRQFVAKRIDVQLDYVSIDGWFITLPQRVHKLIVGIDEHPWTRFFRLPFTFTLEFAGDPIPQERRQYAS